MVVAGARVDPRSGSVSSELDDVVTGARTGPLPNPLVTTIWKPGQASFAGGSGKFEQPTKDVECWPRTWDALVRRLRDGQSLPERADKREHPHLGLYHSPRGFRSNREGDVVVRTGLHVDIDEGATEATVERLLETLRSWGLAALVQRRDVKVPPERKLRAILPLVPDEERTTFHSRACAFLLGLGETIGCPIDLAPAVWSQPTFVYGRVAGREPPRIVALLEGHALDLRGVEGTARTRRVPGEACSEAAALCREMFLAAGSVMHGPRGTRPPDGDNPSAIEVLEDGGFRCWTRPTRELRQWLRVNVPEHFARWESHPGRRIERARSALRTWEAEHDACDAEPFALEQLEMVVARAREAGGPHGVQVPRGVEAPPGVIEGELHAASYVFSAEQTRALRKLAARWRGKRRRARRAFEAIVEDLFFAGRLPTIPETTLAGRAELAIAERILEGGVDDVAEAEPVVDVEDALRRLVGGSLAVTTDGEGRRVRAIPAWAEGDFVMLLHEPPRRARAIRPELRWHRCVGVDACAVERTWHVTVTREDWVTRCWAEVAADVAKAEAPLVWVRDAEVARRLAAVGYDDARFAFEGGMHRHDLVVVFGSPVGWDEGDEGPRAPGFWGQVQREVAARLTELEDALRLRVARPEDAPAHVELRYVGPPYPAPPWRESECRLVTSDA